MRHGFARATSVNAASLLKLVNSCEPAPPRIRAGAVFCSLRNCGLRGQRSVLKSAIKTGFGTAVVTFLVLFVRIDWFGAQKTTA